MSTHNTTAIILAGGMGTRLRPLTDVVPKPLVEVAGRPLIAYAIGFARSAGADRVAVVTGDRADMVESVARGIDSDVAFFYNEHFQDKKSLHADGVFNQLDGSFLLMNADHIYRSSIAERVQTHLGDGIVAFTDTDRTLGGDDMKVVADDAGAHIQSISKELERYTHGYVGMTYCPAAHVPRYRQAIAAAKKRYGNAGVLEHVLQELADSGENVRLGDISGYGWYEIDTPEDYERVQRSITPDDFY